MLRRNCIPMLILGLLLLRLVSARHHDRHSCVGWTTRCRGGAVQQPKQNSYDPYFPKDARSPNPFVEAAPLILAAACDDGSVALVAAHTQISQAQGQEPEPLMYQENPFRKRLQQQSSSFTNNSSGTENDVNATTTTTSIVLQDLPRDFGGPYRIHSLLPSTGQTTPSMVLLVTGWRADCDLVLDMARAIGNSERHQLGSSSSSSRGHTVATRLSIQFAQRAAAEHQRSLSCTALLIVSSSATGDNKDDGPQIWLVDATGAHAVRALCVGRDAMAVNSQFLCRQTFDTARQAHQSLLGFLREDESMKDLASIRLELATVETSSGRLHRIKVEDC
mmetsp:Transcript_17395/g.47499  ORF Transcript_17395/g.47499 Transcript_17395/m.47499 type:complete len:334 (+) Transcript_17395:106-1107(+)